MNEDKIEEYFNKLEDYHDENSLKKRKLQTDFNSQENINKC